MSPREPGRDDAGRPIVAELGRAETPQEFADRKAAASAAHRNNQTMLNLIIALAACLAVVAVIVAIVVRPDQAPSHASVNYVSIAKQAQQSVDTTLVVPHLPASWTANRAELDAGNADGVTSWQIGLLTPSTQYIGLVQGIDADATWTATQLDGARQTSTADYGGVPWRVYDRRDASDTGNLAYALVTTIGRSTVVLGGTATDAEFATLATEIGGELS